MSNETIIYKCSFQIISFFFVASLRDNTKRDTKKQRYNFGKNYHFELYLALYNFCALAVLEIVNMKIDEKKNIGYIKLNPKRRRGTPTSIDFLFRSIIFS